MSAKDFIDLDGNGTPDKEARTLLDNLKGRLHRLLPQNTHTYETGWTGNVVDTSHIDKLCKNVYNSLSRIILEEIAQLEEIDPLEKEIVDHETFGKERAKFFTGRTAILQSIADYIKGNDPHPLAIYGESGSGKSALIARAVHEARQNYPSTEVIYRFIGATQAHQTGDHYLKTSANRYRAASEATKQPYD